MAWIPKNKCVVKKSSEKKLAVVVRCLSLHKSTTTSMPADASVGEEAFLIPLCSSLEFFDISLGDFSRSWDPGDTSDVNLVYLLVGSSVRCPLFTEKYIMRNCADFGSFPATRAPKSRQALAEISP